VPLGAAATVFGFIGMFNQYIDVFKAIELAGDISPSIIASGYGSGGSYPILGLLSLAVSYVFRYINDPGILVKK
jgi:hypothetical protein